MERDYTAKTMPIRTLYNKHKELVASESDSFETQALDESLPL